LKITLQTCKSVKLDRNTKYYATLDPLDAEGNPITEKHFETDRLVPGVLESNNAQSNNNGNFGIAWNQTMVLNVLDLNWKGVLCKLFEENGRCVGSTVVIAFPSPSEYANLEGRYYPLEGAEEFSLQVRMAWYGAKINPGWLEKRKSALPPKAVSQTKILEHTSRSEHLTSEIQKQIAATTTEKNLEIMRLITEKSNIDTNIEKAKQRISRLENLLKKYRDIDDDAKAYENVLIKPQRSPPNPIFLVILKTQIPLILLLSFL
jgi:hypothetical protein